VVSKGNLSYCGNLDSSEEELSDTTIAELVASSCDEELVWDSWEDELTDGSAAELAAGSVAEEPAATFPDEELSVPDDEMIEASPDELSSAAFSPCSGACDESESPHAANRHATTPAIKKFFTILSSYSNFHTKYKKHCL
jgi:hypothetical protein